MSPAHHQLDDSADPAHFNCNLGASLAIWDGLAGSSRTPSSSRSVLRSRPGHRRYPHGAMGLVVDPAVNALKTLIGMIVPKGTAAGSQPPSAAAQACPPPIQGLIAMSRRNPRAAGRLRYNTSVVALRAAPAVTGVTPRTPATVGWERLFRRHRTSGAGRDLIGGAGPRARSPAARPVRRQSG